MSGLFASLSNATQALQAQSQAVNIAGKNMANVNTAGYSRETVDIGSLGTALSGQGPTSLGTGVLATEQMRSALLDAQVTRQASLSAGYTAGQQASQDAQTALGVSIGSTPSTSTNSVGAALDNFFSSFQSLATSPADSSQRQSLLQNASTLVNTLQQTSQALAQVTGNINTQIGTDVTTANRLLQTIANLNGQITTMEVSNPGSALDLRDQRQSTLEQLAAVIPFTMQTAANGTVSLTTKDTSGNDVTLLTGTSVKGTVAFTGTQITAGSPATALSLSGGGSIQGELAARDGPVQAVQTSLDQLSAQLVAGVNAAYNPTGTTGDFFNASGTTAGTVALASGLTVSNLKASDGGAAGDNTIALAVSAVAGQSFSMAGGDVIDGKLGSFFSNAVSSLGQAVSSATSNVTIQTSIEQSVRGQRDSVSGVNLDEETSNLLMYQRAFQASSKVFSTIDTLLNTVINSMTSLSR